MSYHWNISVVICDTDIPNKICIKIDGETCPYDDCTTTRVIRDVLSR